MRNAGTLDNEADARLFSNYLYAKGIKNQADPTRDGKWAIWIHDETQIAEGEQELEQFTANPGAPVYKASQREARAIQANEKRELARSRTQVVDVRTRWGSRAFVGNAGPIALFLIVASIGTFVAQNAAIKNFDIRQLFSITQFKVQGGMLAWDPALPEVLHGQIWRLVTPIFLHFNYMHIIFNMMALYQLGGAIEKTEGELTFGLQVLIFAIVSNLGEFFLNVPTFGGMSGVVFGLFGYVWICGKYDPVRRYFLDNNSVTMVIVWYFLCLSGFLGPIANWAHTVGLVCGILWASIRLRRIPFTNIRF